MTQMLEKAFAKAAKMPAELQEQLAEQLLEDIEGEMKWYSTLRKSQKLLERMARDAREARKHGKTRKKGFDEL
jgi:hypothetical protein